MHISLGIQVFRLFSPGVRSGVPSEHRLINSSSEEAAQPRLSAAACAGYSAMAPGSLQQEHLGAAALHLSRCATHS